MSEDAAQTQSPTPIENSSMSPEPTMPTGNPYTAPSENFGLNSATTGQITETFPATPEMESPVEALFNLLDTVETSNLPADFKRQMTNQINERLAHESKEEELRILQKQKDEIEARMNAIKSGNPGGVDSLLNQAPIQSPPPQVQENNFGPTNQVAAQENPQTQIDAVVSEVPAGMTAPAENPAPMMNVEVQDPMANAGSESANPAPSDEAFTMPEDVKAKLTNHEFQTGQDLITALGSPEGKLKDRMQSVGMIYDQMKAMGQDTPENIEHLASIINAQNEEDAMVQAQSLHALLNTPANPGQSPTV